MNVHQLLNTSNDCYQYLGLTDQGAIRVNMRHSTRLCLQGLSNSVTHFMNLANNLQQQLTNATIGIAQRDTIITNLNQNLLAQHANANAVIADLSESEKKRVVEIETLKKIVDAEGKARKELEDQRTELAKAHETMLEDVLKKHEEELSKAKEELAKAKDAKKNSNKTLTLLLAYCKEERNGLVGFMHRHGFDHFDMGLVEELFQTMIHNEDVEFQNDDGIMLLVDALREVIIQPRLIADGKNDL
jgi:myosin heavy subunit